MNQVNLSGKRAIIYCRVSTQEQKDLGYSLESQEDIIEEFCLKQNITVVKRYKESHSAKDENRPEFQDMISYITTNKNEIDYLLVHKWDRFSRHVSSALLTIQKLNNVNIIVNAISEWRNLDNPMEWFTYLLAQGQAELENKQKSERVRDANYRAYCEGRYINKPPLGYTPSKDALGKTLMKPNPEISHLVSSLLNDYSTGNYSQNKLLEKYKALGLKLSKSNLSRMLSNAVYAGLLEVKEYKGNPSKIIHALHEPLISESTFKRNLFYLNEKNRLKEKPVKDDNNLPLRGKILKCPKCDRNLTGYTKRKANGKEYHYYNCDAKLGCSFSCNATKANQLFVEELKKITPSQNVLKLFEKILIDKYETMYETRTQEIKKLKNRETEILSKQDNLIEKYTEGKISDNAYKRFNDKLEYELGQIHTQIGNVPLKDDTLNKYLSFSLSLISQLGYVYERADIKIKKMIQSSILSGNPIFDGNKYRTLPFKEVVTLLSKYSKSFKNKDTKKGGFFSETSHQVPRAGLEPASTECTTPSRWRVYQFHHLGIL